VLALWRTTGRIAATVSHGGTGWDFIVYRKLVGEERAEEQCLCFGLASADAAMRAAAAIVEAMP
jgi:hypothetical protein